MKKLFGILLMLALVISFNAFAGAQQEEGGGETAGANYQENPEFLEMTKAYYFGEPDANQDMKERWMEAMTETFGFEFRVNAFPRPEYMTKYQLAMAGGDIQGMGWIFGGSYYITYANDGATLPMNDFLADNQVFQSMPEGMEQAYIMEDGKMWAIPNAWDANGFALSIRKDWLDAVGLDVPETIDEYYEAMKRFTEDDPDGNGKDDTIGVTSAGVWNTQHIFQAFGAPPNHVAEHLITPDPNDDMRFTDGMLKPGIEDCLAMMADMYDKGYMDEEIWTNGGSEMRDRMSGGYAGSTFYWINWVNSFQNNAQKANPDAEVVGIMGLTSEYIDENINMAGTGGTPWVIIANSDEPGKQLNAWVNTFWGDVTGYFNGRWGIRDETYELDEANKIITLYRKEDGTGYGGPGISGELPNGLNKYEWTVKVETDEPEDTERRNENYMFTKNIIDETIAEGITYEIVDSQKEPMSEIYRNIGGDIGQIFETEVAEATTGQKTPAEAIESYRKQVKALGGDEMLDQANAFFGKTTPEYAVY